MAGSRSLPAGLVVIGASHRSCPAILRDRLFVSDADAPAVLRDLAALGFADAIVLSTCDRVEVLALHEDREAAGMAVIRVLAGRAGLEPAAAAGHLYTLGGVDALRHVFAVAASLDSQIVGEPQVLGQLKSAHRLALGAGAGGGLEPVMQAAYAVAGRVRSETAIGERPVSMAAAAVQVARDIHGDLGRAGGLLIGDGEMGELVARQLCAAGLRRLSVAAPAASRAAALAERLDCHVVTFDRVAERLSDAEIVVASLGARSYVIGADALRIAIRRRRYRPMFLIDAAVPGDIDPAIDSLEEVFRYDLDALERVALDGRDRRERAAAEAHAIVDLAVAAFLRDRTARTVVPTITALRSHFEQIRQEVLAGGGGGESAEELTRRLVNRLLHEPSEALRELAAGAEGPAERQRIERLIRRLFRLAGGGCGKDEE